MSIIVWEEGFLLGVKQFDEHHEHLVGLINEAFDEYTSDADSNRVDSILRELVDYATYHFAAEEHWMQEQSYHEYEVHCNEHNSFSARINEMLNDSRDDKKRLLLEILTFLNSWFIKHILYTDRKYGRYIADAGAIVS